MEKSHVGMETKICMVSGKSYATGSLLLDNRLEPTLEKYTTTGYGVSPEVQEQLDKGYIALVEVDYGKSEIKNGHISIAGAYRLGRILYAKKEFLQNILTGVEVKEGCPMLYVDSMVVDDFISRMPKDA